MAIGGTSDKVWEMVQNYTQDDQVALTKDNIKQGALTLQNSMISAHNAGDFDIEGNYTYYSDISNPQVVSNEDLGIAVIKLSLIHI